MSTFIIIIIACQPLLFLLLLLHFNLHYCIACQPLLLLLLHFNLYYSIACQPLLLLWLHFNLYYYYYYCILTFNIVLHVNLYYQYYCILTFTIVLHVNLYYYYYCIWYSIAGLLLSLYCWTTSYYCIPQLEALLLDTLDLVCLNPISTVDTFPFLLNPLFLLYLLNSRPMRVFSLIARIRLLIICSVSVNDILN